MGLLLFWLGGRGRARSGLPQGRVVYTDTGGWGRLERPLFSREFQLTGKPDYLVADGPDVIPVEVKSGRAPGAPYDAHIFQLASYCLLVERTYGVRPPFGILHYADREYAIDYTPELEFALMDLLAEVRRDETRAQGERSHQQAGRCAACGYRAVCDQSLA